MQRTWVRRLIGGPLVLWLVMLQFPLPMRAPVAVEKEASSPHPCMHRACGCVTASQCWKSCCCTTKSERIAWARKNLGHVPAELSESPAERPAARACCSKKKPAPKRGPSTVVLSQVQQCRGTSAGWTVFSIAIPAAMGPSIVTAATPYEQAVASIDATIDLLKADLPTPPPRGC